MSKYNRRPNLHSKKPTKLILVIIIVVLLAIVSFWFNSSLSATNTKIKGNYFLEIKAGDNLGVAGDQLAKDGVINSSWSLPIKAQFKDKWTLYPGKYQLSLPASPDQILDQMQSQAKTIEDQNQSKNKGTTRITFREGDTVDDIIQRVVKSRIATESEMTKLAQDPKAFGQSEFAFLPPSLNCQYGNTQNCAKYYLEGYLYPDTYEFASPITAKEIYTKLLKNFDKKVWQKISNKPTPIEFAKVVNMAAVIERETGRPIAGVNDSNRDEFIQEKRLMAGTFFNRLQENMKWQSDPTVTYGTGKSLCQQTLKSQIDCLYLNSPEVKTKYNTYQNVGYPIAPTTSPTLDSIQAVLEPTKNDYLFFVSDASGKKYFAQSNIQHEANIAKVEQINKQYGN
jgi:UPF0755 protein